MPASMAKLAHRWELEINVLRVRRMRPSLSREVLLRLRCIVSDAYTRPGRHRTILRYTISCGVELASPALTALGEHVGDADNIAHAAYKAGGKPISTTFTALRQRRGSRPVALVCTAVERVASKIFYHKYRLIGRAKKTVNTVIAVLEAVEALCAHHLQETDSVPPAESITSAILGTRPSAKVTLPPHAVSLFVGTFHRLSTVFGGDFHVRLADFLSRVSPRGFFAPECRLGGSLREGARACPGGGSGEAT